MPKPNVDSAVVIFDIYEDKPYKVEDEKFFLELIKKAFVNRRKTLVNNLNQGYALPKDKIIELTTSNNGTTALHRTICMALAGLSVAGYTPTKLDVQDNYGQSILINGLINIFGKTYNYDSNKSKWRAVLNVNIPYNFLSNYSGSNLNLVLFNNYDDPLAYVTLTDINGFSEGTELLVEWSMYISN
jgi:hypothetical protein